MNFAKISAFFLFTQKTALSTFSERILSRLSREREREKTKKNSSDAILPGSDSMCEFISIENCSTNFAFGGHSTASAHLFVYDDDSAALLSRARCYLFSKIRLKMGNVSQAQSWCIDSGRLIKVSNGRHRARLIWLDEIIGLMSPRVREDSFTCHRADGFGREKLEKFDTPNQVGVEVEVERERVREEKKKRGDEAKVDSSERRWLFAGAWRDAIDESPTHKVSLLIRWRVTQSEYESRDLQWRKTKKKSGIFSISQLMAKRKKRKKTYFEAIRFSPNSAIVSSNTCFGDALWCN